MRTVRANSAGVALAEVFGLSEVVPGGFSERMLLDERLLLPVPDHVPTEHAALVEPLAVGLRAVAAAEPGPDDVALVVGCGPVGCAIVVALRRAGVPVVASDLSGPRREAARRLGADVVVDPSVESPVEAWRGLGARDLPYSPVLPPGVRRSNALLFECVGMPGMLQTEALDLVAEQKVDLAPFLTGVVAMADIGVAFEQLRHPDKHVKLLVRP